jgi:hypothetical protein
MTSIGLERAGVRLRWFDFIEGPLLIISLPDGWGRPVTAASSRSSHARGSLRLRKRRGQASWLNQNLRGSSGDGDQTHAGQIAAQVAEVCRGDAVITMLADDEAVEDVVPGENGRSGGWCTPCLFEHDQCALADQERARSGQRFVPALVFGRPEAAAARQLFVPYT